MVVEVLRDRGHKQKTSQADHQQSDQYRNALLKREVDTVQHVFKHPRPGGLVTEEPPSGWGRLAAAQGNTQYIEADRRCLDQLFVLLVNYRGHDGMKATRQINQIDHHTATAFGCLTVLAIDVQNNRMAGLECRLQ